MSWKHIFRKSVSNNLGRVLPSFIFVVDVLDGVEAVVVIGLVFALGFVASFTVVLLSFVETAFILLVNEDTVNVIVDAFVDAVVIDDLLLEK